MEVKTTNIDGNDYYTVQQFATLCDKGASQIYILIKKGIIKYETILNKTMIPAEQLRKRDILFPPKRFIESEMDAYIKG